MAESNYVEIRVRANDDKAVADLDVLKAKIDELKAKTAEAKVSVDDKDALARVLAMDVRLDRLSRRVASPRITLEGVTRVVAEVAAVDAALDRLNQQGNAAGRGASGFLGTVQSALQSILSLGPGAIPVLAAIGAAIGTIAAGLGGAIAAIGAAGIGITAFGALAFPTLSKIVAGVSAVSGAATNVARDKAWDAIPKAMQPAVQGILGLKDAADGFARQIQPLVLQVVQGILKVARDLLPAILPIAEVAGKAIDGLLRGFDQFARSAGFQSFMAQMQTLAGPAITAIGTGIGQIAVSLGKLLQQMANPQGVATLSILFKGIALAIDAIGLAFEGLNKTLLPFVSHSLSAAAAIVTAFRFVADAVLGSMQVIIDGAAKAFGWVPGIGKSLRTAAAQFDQFKKSVDDSLTGASAKLNQWAQDVANAPKVFALKADITDLQNKLSTARTLLADPHLTATKRARVEADITQLEEQLAKARAALDALNGKSVTTYVNTVALGLSGTTVHATAGGGSTGGGLKPSVQGLGSQAMGVGGGASGGGWVEARLTSASGDPMIQMLARELRIWVRSVGGAGPHSVQNALGYTRAVT